MNSILSMLRDFFVNVYIPNVLISVLALLLGCIIYGIYKTLKNE